MVKIQTTCTKTSMKNKKLQMVATMKAVFLANSSLNNILMMKMVLIYAQSISKTLKKMTTSILLRVKFKRLLAVLDKLRTLEKESEVLTKMT